MPRCPHFPRQIMGKMGKNGDVCPHFPRPQVENVENGENIPRCPHCPHWTGKKFPVLNVDNGENRPHNGEDLPHSQQPMWTTGKTGKIVKCFPRYFPVVPIMYLNGENCSHSKLNCSCLHIRLNLQYNRLT